MTKQMIEVDIPEGYEFVRYGIPKQGDYYLGLKTCLPELALSEQSSYIYNRIILKKKEPERIIFEKSFEKRRAKSGEYLLDSSGDILRWSIPNDSQHEYYILTKVEE